MFPRTDALSEIISVVACFVTIFLLIDDNGDSDNGKDITI